MSKAKDLADRLELMTEGMADPNVTPIPEVVEFLRSLPAFPPPAHRDVTRALRAETYRMMGGHQPEVQRDLGLLGNTAGRWLLHAIQRLKTDVSNAKRMPWRP